MSRWWLGVWLVAGCHPSDYGGPAAEPPTPSRAPAGEVPREDPATCVGPAVQVASVRSSPEQKLHAKAAQKLVREKLATLGSCTKTLGKAGNAVLSLSYGDAGDVTHARVLSSEVADCSLLECVKQGLTTIHGAPLGPEDTGALVVPVELLPHRAPRLLDQVPLFESTVEAASCVDRGGSLPPQQIQSVVRKSSGAFRHCFEAGLAHDPNLKGRVGIRFVIERDGHVSGASVQENTLPDCEVSRCVRDEMMRIIFPKPDGGTVTVVYPITLDPG